MFTVFRTNSD